MRISFGKICIIFLVLLLVLFFEPTFPVTPAGPLAAKINPPPRIAFPFKYVLLMFSPSPTCLPVPVDGVRASGLCDSWRAPRSGKRKHEGIDIFAKRHTAVRSTTDGVVIRRGTNALGGRVILVAGPRGHVHYYAHLERLGKFKVFDWVRKGDTIGYVGNSGNAATTPPHLHYSIYTPSGAINPYPLLSAQDLKTGKTAEFSGKSAHRPAGTDRLP